MSTSLPDLIKEVKKWMKTASACTDAEDRVQSFEVRPWASKMGWQADIEIFMEATMDTDVGSLKYHIHRDGSDWFVRVTLPAAKQKHARKTQDTRKRPASAAELATTMRGGGGKRPHIAATTVLRASNAAASDAVEGAGNAVVGRTKTALALDAAPGRQNAITAGVATATAPLDGLKICCLGAGDIDSVSGVVEALGATLERDIKNATHALWPLSSPEEGFGFVLRDDVELCLKLGVRVVLQGWLQEENATNPCVMERHMPSCVRELSKNIRVASIDSPQSGKLSTKGHAAATAAQSPAAKPDQSSVAALAQPLAAAKSAQVSEQPAQIDLAGSLKETWEFCKRESPHEVEQGQLRIAIERSLLDSAVQLYTVARGGVPLVAPGAHEETLGVSVGATPEELRTAYRAKVREVHPDKGGKHDDFLRLQRAYLALTGGRGDEETATQPCAELPAEDFVLKSHREMVRALFGAHGVDLENCRKRQKAVISELHLEVNDLGASNTNEQGVVMSNQCFYLALARSYLGGHSGSAAVQLDAVRETALSLKRQIEAAVLKVHPEWAECRVGENVQAFSDFLFFVLGSHALLSELAVVVFDDCSGGAEVYVGRNFPSGKRFKERCANTLVVQYVPGHYKAIVPKGGWAQRPDVDEIRRSLDAQQVVYVVTDRW
jgi:hypothetical protein